MDEQLKAIEDLRRLGILITPPSERVRFPFREFHVIGHTTLDSNELRHGDHWYLYANVGEKPLLVEVKWADSLSNSPNAEFSGERSESAETKGWGVRNMSNTNSLAEWVAEFLCRWSESGVLYIDAANFLIDVVQAHRPLPQGGWSALPSVEDSLRELENLLD